MRFSPKWAFTLALIISTLTSAQSFADDPDSTPYLIVDAKTGNIISANQEHNRWYPASLTKLMTIYITMKAVADGQITIGSPVRISRRAHKMPPSRMGYQTGTLLRIDTALKILIVKSANDVAVAVAESVADNVESFVRLMNKTAQSLGMVATHFTNPSGLHSPNQTTSAYDLAILSRKILLDFPQYSHWFAISSIRTPQKVYYSYNFLLEHFPGANGMKTAFVCASGYNIVASASRGGRKLIAIVLGARSQTQRSILSAQLLSNAFANPNRLIGNILSNNTNINTKPKNLRSVLCTQEAKRKRYDPAAGKAIIKSTYLSDKKIIRKPVLIRTGGTNPTNFSILEKKIPSPAKKLQYIRPRLPDNQQQSDSKNESQHLTPVPAWHPKS